MKAIGYIRVSTEKQAKEGVSIDNQKERIEGYCNYRGYTLGDIIKDEGISGAKNRNRPGFVSLLERIEKNECDALVLYSLERLSRDMLTFLCLERFLDEHDVELHTVEGQIDTSTPDGFIAFAMRVFLGEVERRQVKYRTKKAMEYKKQRGEVVGQIPYGYERNGDNLILNEQEQETIRLVNKIYQDRKSLSFVVKRLIELGHKTRERKDFIAKQVSRIIKDYEPVYCSHNGSELATNIKAFVLRIA